MKEEDIIESLKARNRELVNEASQNVELRRQLIELKRKYEELLLEQQKVETDIHNKESSITEVKGNLDINVWKLENSMYILDTEEKKALARIDAYKAQLDLKNRRIVSLKNEAKDLENERLR